MFSGGDYINTRQFMIYEYLIESKTWIKGTVLAEMFEVSGRTIRSDIERINAELNGIILSNTRKGYKVDKNRLDSVPFKAQTNDVPQTPEDRTFYIIKRLLFDNRKLKIYDLQELLYVSEHTIESDIRRIRRLIKPYSGLKLVRSSNTIYLESDEHTKRKLYKDLLYNEIHGNFMNLDRVAAHYDKFDLMIVKRVFLETLRETKFMIRDSSLSLLMMHLGIMTERMILGCALDKVSSDRIRLDIDTNAFQTASLFLDKLSKSIPIHYNNYEINELANLLLGYQDAAVLQPTLTIHNKTYNLEEAIYETTRYLNEVFGVDLTNDEDFKAGLHLHLQSLIIRAQNVFNIENVYLEELKNQYPLIFEMSVHISSLISKLFDIKVSESETGFISLHLGAAYERNMQIEKYNVILLTNMNQNLTNITRMKIESVFEDRLKIKGTYHYFNSDVIDEHDIDLIICIGTKIEHKLNIPTIKVTTFINSEDESVLFSTLNKLDKRRLKLDFAKRLTDLVDVNYFFTDVKQNSPEEIIGFLSDKLVEDGIVPDTFKSSVLQREALASTSFEYSIATPHPLVFESTASKISVAILDKPVTWGDYEVELVLLLSISPDESDVIEVFFSWLSTIISDESKLQRLITAESRDEFVLWMMEDL